MWTDFAYAGQTADWKYPALAQHATDTALAQMVQGLYDEQQKGLVLKGAPEMSPKIVSLTPTDTPTSADIRDCASDVDWLEYVAATHKLRDAIPGGHRLITARVKKQYNLWRVASYTVQAEGTC